MIELLALVFAVLIAPIIAVAIASSLIIAIYSLFKKRRPDFTKFRGALVSALLLELQFLAAFIIVGLIFSTRASSGDAYGLLILFFGIPLVGIGGFLYFVIRNIPEWCQWGTWRRFMSWAPRDK